MSDCTLYTHLKEPRQLYAYILDMHKFLTWRYFWHAYNSPLNIFLKIQECTNNTWKKNWYEFWQQISNHSQWNNIYKSNGLMIKWFNAKQPIWWVKKVKYFKERKEVMKFCHLANGICPADTFLPINHVNLMIWPWKFGTDLHRKTDNNSEVFHLFRYCLRKLARFFSNFDLFLQVFTP